MKDCIVIKDTLYRCVTKSGMSTISLEFEGGDYNVLKKVFKGQTELSLANQDGKIYATYNDITFLSINETPTAVTVIFSTEKKKETTNPELEERIAELENCVEELAGLVSALAEVVYGNASEEEEPKEEVPNESEKEVSDDAAEVEEE